MNDDTITTATTRTIRPWDTILGGSWGCTLALAYAHAYPRNVRSMVLRGVCMFRPREIDWLFGDPPHPPPLSLSAAAAGVNNFAKRSNTANLRSLLEGGRGRSDAITTSSSITTTAPMSVIATNNDNVTMGTTAVTAAQVFPTGWEEFRKGCDIRPRSAFSKRGNAQTTTSSSTSLVSRRGTLHRYYNLILGSDPIVRNDVVKSWLRWEMGIYSSGFRNRGPSTRARPDEEVEKTDNFNNTVLVWYPSTTSWAYEDARVWNNVSFVSIGTTGNPPPDEMANSLRRFSSSSCTTSSTTSSLGLTSQESHGGTVTQLPFHTMDDNSTAFYNSTTPPTYIPAQSMLTVFYSANDDYCIGRYKSFLSMETQPQSDDTTNDSNKSTWFSSALPPEIPNAQFTTPESSSRSKMSSPSSFPLPPTIAIQGGNDAICPPDTALDLHQIWKELELRIVLQSGHSMYDPLIAGEIVKALDRFGHSLIAT